ncbi:MAG: hypothetical protein QGG71_23180 [Pirellulaceae bacterium]|jgi:hypothetical protein|nr:hypothetical protein [Pirellulaceae bacterium]
MTTVTSSRKDRLPEAAIRECAEQDFERMMVREIYARAEANLEGVGS